MEEGTLDKLTKEVERITEDWDYSDLPTKQELYLAEEREIAYKAGIKEGHTTGFNEGAKSERVLIIRQMYQKGLSQEEIEDLTGISIEEQNNLIKKED